MGLKTGILIIAICTVAWLSVIPIFYIKEKKEYSDGVCKCGGKLRYFDTDSQGGRGYVCDECRRVMWLSWYKPKK